VTPEQIALVRESWRRVAASGMDAAGLFYKRLFALDPSMRGQFRADITSQGKKLLDMMQSIVGGLDDMDALLPAARELGRRHHYYGVRDEDYDTVREAMMWMIAEALHGDFAAPAEEAWRQLYEQLAAAMIEGARAAGGPRGG
jgi:hemoglobin-like flavoprotein